jgi:hypothetical protein
LICWGYSLATARDICLYLFNIYRQQQQQQQQQQQIADRSSQIHIINPYAALVSDMWLDRLVFLVPVRVRVASGYHIAAHIVD